MFNTITHGVLEQAGGGNTNALSPGDASGGIITYDGDYRIHTFDSSGYFVVYNLISEASILIVGGGGKGQTGGGGGGQVLQYNISYINASTYEVIVGSGGVSNTIEGKPSSFYGYVANNGIGGNAYAKCGYSGSGIIS